MVRDGEPAAQGTATWIFRMATLISLLDALTGPLLVMGGLWLTVRHFKLARTVSYIERFNDPGMIETRAAVDAWLSSSDSDEHGLEKANAKRQVHRRGAMG